MRKLPWAVLALLGTVTAVNVASTGCGSDESSDITDDGGSETSNPNPPPPPPPPDMDGSFLDVITDGSRDGDAFACTNNGDTCASSTDCCSGNCITPDGGTTKICGNPIGMCTPTGSTCPADPTQCCQGACIGGLCGRCVDNNGACATSADCCGGGTCVPDGKGGGICQAINCSPAPCTPTCKTDGNSCTADSQCCGGFCNAGQCSGAVSFCTQTGDVCTTDGQCCGGVCTKASGSAFGLCGITSAPGSGGCNPDGQLCPGGSSCDMNCCSHACGTFGALGGKTICQPASGCSVTGDICRTDNDCCGHTGSPPPVDGPEHCSKSSPSQTFGRCDQGMNCNEPGIICKAPNGAPMACNGVNNCCEGFFADGGAVPSQWCNDQSKCCGQDALGIWRCLQIQGGCSPPPPAGTMCITSADCCGLPCVGNKCLGSCVMSGSVCTIDADCCTGLPCTKSPGASTGICGGVLTDAGTVVDASAPPDGGGNLPDGGTCALYGQNCTTTSECCNTSSGVQCIGTPPLATCRFP